MLETIRELAAEKLSAEGEAAAIRTRHAEHYLAVAQRRRISTPRRTGPQRHDLVIPESDNMRAALAWALESGEHEFGLELVVSLENYWATSLPEEGLEWATTLLDAARRGGRTCRRARAARPGRHAERPRAGRCVGAELGGGASRSIGELGDERGVAIASAPLLEHRHAARRRAPRARARRGEPRGPSAERRIPEGRGAGAGVARVGRSPGRRPRGRARAPARELRALARPSASAGGSRACSRTSATYRSSSGRLDDARSSARQALTLSNAMHDRRGSSTSSACSRRSARAQRRPATRRCPLGAAEAEGERAPVGRWIHGVDEAVEPARGRRPRVRARARGGPPVGARRSRRGRTRRCVTCRQGTVTFLFTDVEGSTRLLQELGAEQYAVALAEHRRRVREACARHGGVEVDTQGDAFFFAFPTAPGGARRRSETPTDALERGPIRCEPDCTPERPS